MLDLLVGLFGVVAPVFICAGIGYAWVRLGKSYDTETVSGLAANFGAPCLVAVTMARVEIDPATLGSQGLATVVCLVAFGLIGWTVLRLLKWPVQPYLPGLIFANGTNMGLALSLFAFGPEGLAMAAPMAVISGTGTFTVGIAITSGTWSPRRLLALPMVYGLIIGLFFQFSGVPLPYWLERTAEILGSMIIPLMLITLGVSLARLRPGGLTRSASLGALRLAMGFGVSVLVADLFGLEGMARGVLIIQMSMPTAVFNYILALRYGSTADEVAGMVVFSTLASFVLLPGLMWYVM